MISLTELNAASDADFVTTLAGIYEHSDWIPLALAAGRPFPDIDSLRLAMRKAVETTSEAGQLALIRAHPDLAGKLAKAGKLTLESTREQAGLGLDRLDDAEYGIFHERNARYRNRFGFPFIICARLTTKQGVLDAFEERLKNSREMEIPTALEQIHEIARLRLEDLLES